MEEKSFEEQTELKEVSQPLNAVTGGFSFSALVVIYLIVSMIASVIISAVTKNVMIKYNYANSKEALAYIEKTEAYIYVSYLLSPLIISLCALLVLRLRKIKFKYVFPVKCRPKYFLIGVLLIFGLLFSLSWTNDVSVRFFELFGYVPKESSSYFPDLSGGKVVLALLVMAVMPAFFEELMFRGILLNNCEDDLGTVRAVFITGFCFSLFHASPEQTVYQFIAGCAFALIAVRSGSILPSVMMHFINNALIVILQAAGAFNEEGAIIMSSGANTALIILSAISLVVALILLILNKNTVEKLKGGKKISFIFDGYTVKKCRKGSVRSFFKYASLAVAVLGVMWLLSLFGVNL